MVNHGESFSLLHCYDWRYAPLSDTQNVTKNGDSYDKRIWSTSKVVVEVQAHPQVPRLHLRVWPRWCTFLPLRILLHDIICLFKQHPHCTFNQQWRFSPSSYFNFCIRCPEEDSLYFQRPARSSTVTKCVYLNDYETLWNYLVNTHTYVYIYVYIYIYTYRAYHIRVYLQLYSFKIKNYKLKSNVFWLPFSQKALVKDFFRKYCFQIELFTAYYVLILYIT